MAQNEDRVTNEEALNEAHLIVLSANDWLERARAGEMKKRQPPPERIERNERRLLCRKQLVKIVEWAIKQPGCPQ